MAHRTYERNIRTSEDLDVPDWWLLGRIFDLVKPYMNEMGRVTWSAEDGRGTYESKSLDEFRAEVEVQDEKPRHITFVYENFGREPSLRYQLGIKHPDYI
ncbi:MAG: hypothetical protein ACRDQZ_18990, partial [Mycobacteriales bacterium]